MAERDFSALTDPVDQTAVVVFHDSVKRLGGYNEWSRSSQIGSTIAGILLVLAPILVVTLLFAQVQREPAGPTLVIWTVAVVVVGLTVMWAGVQVIASALRGLDRRENWFRYRRFAADNGLGYAARSTNEHGFRGSFFSPGTATLFDRFTTDQGYEYGTVRRNRNATATRKAGEHHVGGYLAIRLDRKLPRMLLDSHSNSRLRDGVGSELDVSQRLELEGDFGRHFALYVPSGYERDALYVFTPDLMAALIDEAADFDVEIADDWMFVYPAKPFDFRDPRVHSLLAELADVVGHRASRRSANYRDERAGSFTANLIAPHGRRLRGGGVPLYASLVAGAVIVVLIAPPIASAVFDWR